MYFLYLSFFLSFLMYFFIYFFPFFFLSFALTEHLMFFPFLSFSLSLIYFSRTFNVFVGLTFIDKKIKSIFTFAFLQTPSTRFSFLFLYFSLNRYVSAFSSFNSFFQTLCVFLFCFLVGTNGQSISARPTNAS